MEDRSVEMIYLDDPEGEELKAEIQEILRNQMPEAETMGKLVVLPGESARGASVQLRGLVTVYEGVYYDDKSYEYYTFPDIGRIHQMLYSMCCSRLSDGDSVRK